MWGWTVDAFMIGGVFGAVVMSCLAVEGTKKDVRTPNQFNE